MTQVRSASNGTTTTGAVEEVEKIICSHPLVCNCVVVGEEQDYFSALLAPNKSALVQRLEEDFPSENHTLDSYHRLNSIDVRRYFCDLLEEANARLKGKRVERIALLDLATGKPREILCEENRPIIDSFYQEYIPGIG